MVRRLWRSRTAPEYGANASCRKWTLAGARYQQRYYQLYHTVGTGGCRRSQEYANRAAGAIRGRIGNHVLHAPRRLVRKYELGNRNGDVDDYFELAGFVETAEEDLRGEIDGLPEVVVNRETNALLGGETGPRSAAAGAQPGAGGPESQVWAASPRGR